MIPHDSWVFHIYSIYISIYFYIFLLFSYFSWDIYGKFMVLFRWIFLCQVNELCSKMNLVLPPSRWFPLPPRCPFWRRPQHDVWRKGSLEDDLRKCNFWRKWSEDLCISDISIIFNHFQSFSIPAVPFYLAFPLENPLKTQLFWLVSLCQLMSASGSENAACLELFFR